MRNFRNLSFEIMFDRFSTKNKIAKRNAIILEQIKNLSNHRENKIFRFVCQRNVKQKY